MSVFNQSQAFENSAALFNRKNQLFSVFKDTLSPLMPHIFTKNTVFLLKNIALSKNLVSQSNTYPQSAADQGTDLVTLQKAHKTLKKW